MPVTLYLKSPILRIYFLLLSHQWMLKCCLSMNLWFAEGIGIIVILSAHCHKYFWPTVYNPSALSYPIRLWTLGYSSLHSSHCPGIIKEAGPMCQITYVDLFQISKQHLSEALEGLRGNYSSSQFNCINRVNVFYCSLESFMYISPLLTGSKEQVILSNSVAH